MKPLRLGLAGLTLTTALAAAAVAQPEAGLPFDRPLTPGERSFLEARPLLVVVDAPDLGQPERLAAIERALASPRASDRALGGAALAGLAEAFPRRPAFALPLTRPPSPEGCTALGPLVARAASSEDDVVREQAVATALRLMACAPEPAPPELLSPRLRGLTDQFDPATLAEHAGEADLNRGPGLYRHMRNAIDTNLARRGIYAALAGARGGDSTYLSWYLVVNEALTLPVMAWYDWKAGDFVAAGIPVLAEDVIPLRPRPIDTPPRHRGVASEAQRGEVAREVDAFTGDVEALLDAQDFAGVADRAWDLVRWIDARQRGWGCHFAMTRHMIATIGYGALRAVEHAEASGGETRDLSAGYLGSALLGLGFAQDVDAMAQPLHAEGSGILVNEFPGGYFRRAYRKARRGR